MINRLIPFQYKKWFTLLGGVMIHLSLGNIYTFGNMSPYLTSYLREMTGSNVRYAQTVWILTVLSLCLSFSSMLCGILVSNFKINTKLIVFCGCMLMSLGNALTFYTINMSYIMAILTAGAINGFGTGLAYLGPLSIVMKWFPHSTGLANSAILFGFGGSALIFDQIVVF